MFYLFHYVFTYNHVQIQKAENQKGLMFFSFLLVIHFSTLQRDFELADKPKTNLFRSKNSFAKIGSLFQGAVNTNVFSEFYLIISVCGKRIN